MFVLIQLTMLLVQILDIDSKSVFSMLSKIKMTTLHKVSWFSF
jgi:hypothetical protein